MSTATVHKRKVEAAYDDSSQMYDRYALRLNLFGRSNLPASDLIRGLNRRIDKRLERLLSLNLGKP